MIPAALPRSSRSCHEPTRRAGDRTATSQAKHYDRGVSDERLSELARLGSATVYEAGGRAGYVDADLHQIVPGSRVAGPARTVRCGQDDNLMVHAVIEQIEPGDVVVLSMPEPRAVALVGDLLATQAKVAGAAGLLIDASVRDVEELAQLGLPIWARWVRVCGATKTEVGEIGVPVLVGGARIDPGDAVVLDVAQRLRGEDRVPGDRGVDPGQAAGQQVRPGRPQAPGELPAPRLHTRHPTARQRTPPSKPPAPRPPSHPQPTKRATRSSSPTRHTRADRPTHGCGTLTALASSMPLSCGSGRSSDLVVLVAR